MGATQSDSKNSLNPANFGFDPTDEFTTNNKQFRAWTIGSCVRKVSDIEDTCVSDVIISAQSQIRKDKNGQLYAESSKMNDIEDSCVKSVSIHNTSVHKFNKKYIWHNFEKHSYVECPLFITEDEAMKSDLSKIPELKFIPTKFKYY